MARDTLIFILQHLGFLINIKKSYLEPTSTLEFVEVIVDSVEMTLSLSKEKILRVQNQCKEILEKEKATVRKPSKLIHRLVTNISRIISVEAREQLLWWEENLTMYNRRSLILSPPQIILLH